MPQNFLSLLQLLASQGIEFVVVGGVAATLHGGRRTTFDLDVVPRLSSQSWDKTIRAVWKAGGRPRIPESLDRISDVENVRRWMDEKGMRALTFRSADGVMEIDFLVQESHRFDQLLQRAELITVDGVQYAVASIDDLIAMKREAGRPQDLVDIAELEAIKSARTTAEKK